MNNLFYTNSNKTSNKNEQRRENNLIKPVGGETEVGVEEDFGGRGDEEEEAT